MADVIRFLSEWFISWLEHVGAWGIFIALAIESACIPITSEIFLLFGGFLVAQNKLSLYSVAVAGVIGFTVGSLVPYCVGRFYGSHIMNMGGRFLFASSDELRRVEKWFQGKGETAVIYGRLIPFVRNFVSLPAGHAKMPLMKFVVYTILGSAPWIFAAAYVGRLVEREWHTVLDVIERGNRVIIACIIVVLFILIMRGFKHRKNAV